MGSSSTAKKTVLIPVGNGMEAMEAVITAVILRRVGADVTVASVEEELVVEASHVVKLVADYFIGDCSHNTFDLILLPVRTYGGVPESGVHDQRLYGKVATTGHGGPEAAMENAVKLVDELIGTKMAQAVYGPLLMRSNHSEEHLLIIRELNPVDWTFKGETPLIIVPIANGIEETEATITIDVLRRAKAKVIVASIDEKLEIVGSMRLKLVADLTLDEAETLPYDLIVLPGGLGGSEAFLACEKLVNMLKKQRDSNLPYGAICAAPALVLEPLGLLEGKKATAFPGKCNKLSDGSEIENRVVVDGNLITTRAPGTTVEFALAIIQKFYGRDKALELAKPLLSVHAEPSYNLIHLYM